MQPVNCTIASCQCLTFMSQELIFLMRKSLNQMTSFDKFLFIIEQLKSSYIRKKDIFQFFVTDLKVCEHAFCSYYGFEPNLLSLAKTHIRYSTTPTSFEINQFIEHSMTVPDELYLQHDRSAVLPDIFSNKCLPVGGPLSLSESTLDSTKTKQLSQYVLVDRNTWSNQTVLCQSCSEEMILISSFNEGLYEQLNFYCKKCRIRKRISNSESSPIRYQGKKGKGYKEINVLATTAVNTCGLTYTNYSQFFKMLGLPMSAKFGFHHLSRLIWDHAVHVANKSFQSILDSLKENTSLQLVLCGDGAWAHRGWTSSQGCYIVFDAHSKRVVKVFTFHHDRTVVKSNDKELTYRKATIGKEQREHAKRRYWDFAIKRYWDFTKKWS